MESCQHGAEKADTARKTLARIINKSGSISKHNFYHFISSSYPRQDK